MADALDSIPRLTAESRLHTRVALVICDDRRMRARIARYILRSLSTPVEACEVCCDTDEARAEYAGMSTHAGGAAASATVAASAFAERELAVRSGTPDLPKRVGFIFDGVDAPPEIIVNGYHVGIVSVTCIGTLQRTCRALRTQQDFVVLAGHCYRQQWWRLRERYFDIAPRSSPYIDGLVCADRHGLRELFILPPLETPEDVTNLILI